MNAIVLKRYHCLLFDKRHKNGVDTEQVDEMMDVETAGLRKLPLHYLSEKLSFGERTVTYRAPVAS